MNEHDKPEQAAATPSRVPDRPAAAAKPTVSPGIGLVQALGALGGNQAVRRAFDQAASGQAAGQTAPDFAERLGATGGGRPIPSGPRENLESGLGVPLDGVRVHTGPDSAALADEVGARAFTVGQDVHFGHGQYDPGSRSGYQLLAHEVTHTLQQGSPAAPARASLSVSTPDSAPEREADRVAETLADQRDDPGEAPVEPVSAVAAADIGRRPEDGGTPQPPANPTPPPAGGTPGAPPGAPGQVAGLSAELAASLSNEDKAALAQGFPQGVTAAPPTTMIVGLNFGTSLVGYRVPVIRLTAAAPVGQGVEAHILQIGKGRSILMSSIGGGSVLFDAGTGQTRSINAAGVQRLVSAIGAVTASGVQVPQLIKLSHADTDHYNAARALLQQAAYSRTAVEVAVQQMGAGSGGAWTSSSLTVQPNQQLITINVAGANVQVSRTVIDNMELTEFRSVAAAQEMTEPGRTTFNRNRTSPVVIVRDLVNGQRTVLTADAEGRQFDEIVNSIGDGAMRRLLGAEGRNLRAMEAPHHYGKQAGPDAQGMLNMLQMAYESGEGSLRLFAQTTQQFATNESRQIRSFNFLDTIGVAPERIENDPSPPGQAQVTRARGSTMERVTLDFAGVQQAIQTVQANDTPLRQAYARLAEVTALRAEAGAMRDALQGRAPAPMLGSVTAIDADLVAASTAIQTAVDAVWSQARTSATNAGSLRGSANFTGVTQALTQVTNTLTAQQQSITRSANSMAAHTENLSVYTRLYVNAVRMIAALEAENVADLHARRAEHTDLVRAAAGQLGPAEVHEHVRSAWAAVRAEWTPQRIEEATREASARIAQRQMSVQFRATLSQSLQRQMELNALVAQAEHGGRTAYGPGGTIVTPARTRIGAGIFAMIEVIRIGLDIAVQVKEANQAAAENQAVAARTGNATMTWWRRLGVEPTIALVKRGWWSGWNIVCEDQTLAKQAATQPDRPPNVPEFDMVVVTGVDANGLRSLVHRLVAELAATEDWIRFVDSYPGEHAFSKLGADWAIPLWHRNDEQYRYITVDSIAPGLGAELDRLRSGLDAGQEARMARDAAVAGPDKVGTVRNSAIIGVDREVYVYNRHGGAVEIDFEQQPPRFIREATVQYPFRMGEPMVRVKAADIATYQRLSGSFWVRDTGQQYMDQSGTHDERVIESNAQGLAYVRPKDVQTEPANAPASR